MNICITNHDMQPQFVGGIKRVSCILGQEWSKHHNISFITFSPKELQEEYRKINNITQYFFPNTDNILADENIEFFCNYIKENKIDVILNQHTEDKEFTELCVRVKEIKNVRLVCTLHFAITHTTDTIRDSFFIKYKLNHSPVAWIRDLLLFIKYHCYTKHKINKEQRNYFKYLIQNADKIVLLSKSHIEAFKKQAGSNNEYLKRITAISNPIDIPKYIPTLKNHEVLWCGRVGFGIKRVDRIMEIWKSVAPRHPEWELIIMGSGDIKYYRELAKRYQIPNITFTGSCNPYEHYQDGAILCNTSSTEGLPMTILEAQSQGCVPIAFNSFSSLSDVINDGINGFIVKAFDKKEYAQKIEQLMTNEELRNRMAEEGRKTIQKFNVTAIAKEWIQLFNSL